MPAEAGIQEASLATVGKENPFSRTRGVIAALDTKPADARLPGSLPARLRGEVLNFFLESLLAKPTKHGTRSADHPTCLLGVT